MADIFISYKREDRRVAERLSIALEQLGFDVWWDFELLSGDGYRRVIERVIDECGATIVLWSELSRESAFVVDEATYSREQNKLCPARIDDCRLPLGFGGDHSVDLRGWEGEMGHDGLQALLRAIELKTGKKARLGARPRGQDEESRFAEMEAFKAAEAAGVASALQSFLRDYPHGAFANFVRGQLETIAATAMALEGQGQTTPTESAPRRQPPRAPPQSASQSAFQPTPQQTPPQTAHTTPKPTPKPTHGAAISAPSQQPRSSLWLWIASLIGLALASTIVFVVLPRGSPSIAPPATIAATKAAYDLAALDAQVRAAVEGARRNETLANAAAARAQAVAQRAEANIYGERNGEDVRVFSGDHAGDRYAGQLADNRYAGVGVYAWGENAANSFGGRSIAGEFANDAPNGAGVYAWRDGKRYAGQLANWRRQGSGVFNFADGRRYEGQWSDDQQSGFGVEWDAGGRLSQQGVWTRGALTTPLTNP